ncbi:InlB B-repeat-containing protein, partial [Streptococcus dentasini]
MKHTIREKQRFSIRKRKHIGAGSILLGLTLFMVSLGASAKSEDLVTQNSNAGAVQLADESPNVADSGDASAASNEENQDSVNEAQKAARTVTITYTVVYVDTSGQEVYRTTKTKTVTVLDQTPASTSVTENGEAISSAAALANYQLLGGAVTQTITESADNTITLQVTAKETGEDSKKAGEDREVSEPSSAVSTSWENTDQQRDRAPQVAVVNQNTINSATEIDSSASPRFDLKPEESQPLVRAFRASVASSTALNIAATAPESPSDSELPPEPDEAADISGLGITEVKFYNENELVSTQYVKAGDYLLEPNLPISGDKAFKGWLYNSQILDFSQPVDFPAGEEVAIHANYSDTVRVTFKNDEGVIVSVKEIPTGTTTDADDVAILSPKDSFIFSHWSTSPNGSDSFDFNRAITQDTTLYAVIKNQKTITFDSNGGTSITSIYIDSGSVADNLPNGLPQPTRQGYTFAGWINSRTGAAVDTAAEITNDQFYKAQWTANTDTPYKVVYWIENPTGTRESSGINYAVGAIDELRGRTGDPIIHRTPTFLTSNNLYDLSSYQPEVGQKSITGDGEAVLNVYYERHKFRLDVVMRTYWGNNTSTYYVKWGEPLTPYLDNKGVSSWRISPSNNLLARLNYPMPTQDTTVTQDTIVFSARPTLYYIDVDTGETINQVTINSSVGNTLNITAPVEGYNFVRIEGQRPGATSIRIDGSDIRAYYRKKKFNVTFVTNNDAIRDFVSNVDYKSRVEPLVPTSMEQYVTKKKDEFGVSYVFTGWYDNAATSGESVDFSDARVPSGGLVYYAGWAKEYVDVTVHKDTVIDNSATDKYVLLVSSGNSVLNPDNKYAVLDSGGNVEKDETGTPLVDSRKVFDGELEVNDKINFDGSLLAPTWYKLVNGRLEKANLADEITEPGTVLVPVWEYPAKTIVYNANGGSDAPATDDLQFLENTTIVDQGNMKAPSEEQVFTGWNTSPDGSGKRYTPREVIAFNQFSGNTLTLYAQWRQNPDYNFSTITYNPNGGNGSVVEKRYKANSPVYIRNQGYWRPDHNLIGWFTKEGAVEGDESYGTGAKIPASNMTLYAVWTEKLTAQAVTPNILVDKTDAGGKSVVTTNKPNATIVPSTDAYGLSIDENGHLVGRADVTDWNGSQDEERNISLSVSVTLKVTRPNGNSTNEVVTVQVPIQVQRDTDGDGEPDVTDVDDDGDGLSDDQDQNPKRRDTTGPL